MLTQRWRGPVRKGADNTEDFLRAVAEKIAETGRYVARQDGNTLYIESVKVTVVVDKRIDGKRQCRIVSHWQCKLRAHVCPESKQGFNILSVANKIIEYCDKAGPLMVKADEDWQFLNSVCVELTGKHVVGRSFTWRGINVSGGEKILVSLGLPTDLSARQTIELLRDINKAKERQCILDAE